ncbi:MAG: hypothetical protein GEU94_06435, partial [Micromonosporaceae bacterium]|nr:hypothetical protein [Micromonosporaceae bacterium]
MAGIAAYFGSDQTALSDLSEGLGSRGPDGSGWSGGKLGLVIRAALPTIHTSAAGLTAVVDGIAETSRLLNEYVEHGPEALVQTGEPYTIAVADPDREALLLGRAGDGPGLYYAEVAGNVYAAAEPAALFAAGVPAVPDREVVRRFVDTGVSDDNGRTFFSRVRRVVPGQVVEITANGIRTHTVPAGLPQPPTSAPLAIQEAVRHGRIGVRL